MTYVIKPVPDHHFHKYPDELLISMVNEWRRCIHAGHEHTAEMRRLIDTAYKVLGYRCALEYVNRYEIAGEA